MPKGKKHILNCQNCNKQFREYSYLGRERRFCSSNCYHRFYRGKKRPEHSRRLKGQHNPKIGKRIGVPHTLEAIQKIRESKIGSRNPAWIDGRKKKEGYSEEFNRELKRKIFERDSFKCRICGINKNIAVHHIDYNKKNCNFDNLITLCRSHNSRVNWNRDFWKLYINLVKNDIPVKINIGCGIKKELNGNGWINIDRTKETNPDLVMDITNERDWTRNFQENSTKEIKADYVLCQVCEKNKFLRLMNKLHWVLKPGGLFKIKVPNAMFPAAFQDPMDCRYFVKETFDYFDKDHYRYKVFHYGFSPWEIVKIEPERGDRIYAILRKPYDETRPNQ